MEIRYKSPEDWLDTAVSGIRFAPDRAEVREELRAHISDKMDDLERIFPGIPPGELRERALAGMGDPEELKTALARVHRPWLGYLWRASQVILAVALFLAAALTVKWGLEPGWYTRAGDRGSLLPADAEEIVALEPARERARINGYTIAMTEAARWSAPGETPGSRYPRLTVTLRASSPWFWAKGGDWYLYVSAVDSEGNQYPDTSYYRGGSWAALTGDSYISASAEERDIFSQNYRFSLDLADDGAEWVRLEYERLGRGFSMTVYLKGAET